MEAFLLCSVGIQESAGALKLAGSDISSKCHLLGCWSCGLDRGKTNDQRPAQPSLLPLDSFLDWRTTERYLLPHPFPFAFGTVLAWEWHFVSAGSHVWGLWVQAGCEDREMKSLFVACLLCLRHLTQVISFSPFRSSNSRQLCRIVWNIRV
jgi:hypothetical protein